MSELINEQIFYLSLFFFLLCDFCFVCKNLKNVEKCNATMFIYYQLLRANIYANFKNLLDLKMCRRPWGMWGIFFLLLFTYFIIIFLTDNS